MQCRCQSYNTFYGYNCCRIAISQSVCLCHSLPLQSNICWQVQEPTIGVKSCKMINILNNDLPYLCRHKLTRCLSYNTLYGYNCCCSSINYCVRHCHSFHPSFIFFGQGQEPTIGGESRKMINMLNNYLTHLCRHKLTTCQSYNTFYGYIYCCITISQSVCLCHSLIIFVGKAGSLPFEWSPENDKCSQQ